MIMPMTDVYILEHTTKSYDEYSVITCNHNDVINVSLQR